MICSIWLANIPTMSVTIKNKCPIEYWLTQTYIIAGMTYQSYVTANIQKVHEEGNFIPSSSIPSESVPAMLDKHPCSIPVLMSHCHSQLFSYKFYKLKLQNKKKGIHMVQVFDTCQYCSFQIKHSPTSRLATHLRGLK